MRFKKLAHIFVLPICFFLYHFLHGIGVFWGLLKLLTGTFPFKGMKEPWPGSNKFRAID
jgi:Na+/H+-dicarboxylate symporter